MACKSLSISLRVWFIGMLFFAGAVAHGQTLPADQSPQQFCKEGEYCLLAPLPLSESGALVGSTDVGSYIKNVVRLTIALAGALAVLQIIFAGFQYITTEAMSGKSSARKDINNALIGLMLAIGAYVILNTINPRLVNFDLNIANQKIGGAFDPNSGTIDANDPNASSTPATPGAPCPNCTAITDTDTSIPHKPVGAGCKSPGPCYIENRLAGGLQKLAAVAKSEHVDWWVTEMYPPTATHTSSCHRDTPNAGKCVDAALRGISASDPNAAGWVIRFSRLVAQNVNNSSNAFQWEVPTQNQLTFWTDAIKAWMKAHPGDPETSWGNDTIKRFVVNPCPTCSLHIHINSPSLNQ